VVTNEALTKGDLNHLIGHFVDADRNRLKNDSDKDDYGDKLDGRIEQINQTWKAKFGHEFDAKKIDDVFSDQFATIRQGQIGNDPQLAAAVIHNSNQADRTNVDKHEKDANGNTKGDQNLESGRSIAVVTIAGDKGANITVPLIHELPDSWKINVPDNMSKMQLRQNLLDQLTAVGDMSAQWPADENQAYRAVASHVLLAILGPGSDIPVSPVNGPTDMIAK